VHHADALHRLSSNAALHDASVITSLPDVSELSGVDLEASQAWFVTAAKLTLQAVPVVVSQDRVS
jgi:hypothetical protein